MSHLDQIKHRLALANSLPLRMDRAEAHRLSSIVYAQAAKLASDDGDVKAADALRDQAKKARATFDDMIVAERAERKLTVKGII